MATVGDLVVRSWVAWPSPKPLAASCTAAPAGGGRIGFPAGAAFVNVSDPRLKQHFQCEGVANAQTIPRSGSEENVFNCAVFIDDEGKICGKYHKMQFAEGYHSDWWFNRLGNHSRAFDTPYGRCGVMICNDRWNSRLAKIPALDGAQFLVIPSFGSKSKAQDKAVLSRAIETDLPIIEANVGVTLIVSNGQTVAVDRKEEGITFAEISIPPKRMVQETKRDQIEAEFLKWRTGEMKRRYQKTIDRLQKK